jgi:hypothetical protein
MKIYLKIGLIAIIVATASGVYAQANATAKLDTNSILVGDQVNLELILKCPADYKVIWPHYADTLIKEIEIVNRTPVDTVKSSKDAEILYRQQLTLTSFDSGYYAIPPFRFGYSTTGDTTINYIETDAELLTVKTVPVNMQDNIKDIKGPMSAPFTFREALPYILLFLGVAAVTFLVVYYLRKKKKAEPMFRAPTRPKIPPYQAAIEALETLRMQKLWQNGHIKEYHTQLTDIIREYLYSQFSIQALEYTSDEIMDAVNATAANQQAKEKLRQTLNMADLVKFAKMQPLPLEHDTSLNNAIDFVRETSHLAIEPATELATEFISNSTKPEETVNKAEEAEIEIKNEGKEAEDVQ